MTFERTRSARRLVASEVDRDGISERELLWQPEALPKVKARQIECRSEAKKGALVIDVPWQRWEALKAAARHRNAHQSKGKVRDSSCLGHAVAPMCQSVNGRGERAAHALNRRIGCSHVDGTLATSGQGKAKIAV